MHADSKSLRDLHGNADIRVSRYDGGVADRLVPGQVDEVGYKEGVYFLLLAGAVDGAKPQFDIVRVRKNQVFGGRAIARTVVPVDAQKCHSSALCQRKSC